MVQLTDNVHPTGMIKNVSTSNANNFHSNHLFLNNLNQFLQLTNSEQSPKEGKFLFLIIYFAILLLVFVLILVELLILPATSPIVVDGGVSDDLSDICAVVVVVIVDVSFGDDDDDDELFDTDCIFDDIAADVVDSNGVETDVDCTVDGGPP